MSEAYFGEIRMFAGDFAPVGWYLCHGQLLQIAENEALYSLLGTTYGGDGQTNFALPDFRGRAVLHQGQNNVTGTLYPMGQKGGTETVALTTQELPAHTHLAQSNSGAGTSDQPAGKVWSNDNTTMQYSDNTDGTEMNANAIEPIGQGVAHNNMMPFLTINYIICYEGYYPSFN